MKFNLPLTIFLIKKKYTNYEDILDKDGYNIDSLSIKEHMGIRGKAFIGENKQRPSEWNDFLDNMLIDYKPQTNQSSRAVLFIKRSERIFAFTFGHGRHLLKDEAYERNFGLKVILNNAKRNSIKSIDSSLIDEKPFQNRTQASRASRMEDFNLTDIRTLFRGITAECINEDKYGPTLKGKDSFRINYKYEITDLNYLCEMLLEDYNNTSYRKKFPEIDRLVKIKDPDIINKLNTKMIKKLIKNEDIFLMIPDIIDWEITDGFSYTEKGPVYPFPSLSDFLEIKKINKKNLSLEYLKSHYLLQKSEDTIINKWSIHKCICTEVIHENIHYVFSMGEWFEIKKDLIKKVDEFINNLSICDVKFPVINGLHEKDANILIANKIPKLLNMDRKNMYIDGDPYEVCDLLSIDKKLIHVKWWDSSATLSHLFSQGKVSSEIISSEQNQRKEINKKIRENNSDFINIIEIDNFSPEEYTIVFAIIYDGNKTITERLPFFSKVNLMQSTRELRSMKYNVEIAHIKSSCKRLGKKENQKVMQEKLLLTSSI